MPRALKTRATIGTLPSDGTRALFLEGSYTRILLQCRRSRRTVPAAQSPVHKPAC